MLLCSTICPEDDIEKKKISLGKEIPGSVQRREKIRQISVRGRKGTGKGNMPNWREKK